MREKVPRVREAIGHDPADGSPSAAAGRPPSAILGRAVTRILRALLCGLTIALVAGATGVVAQAATPSETGAAAPPVRLVELDGPLDRAAAVFLSREIDAAGDAGDALVLIRLDGTSGPADDMRDALDAVGGSAVPVAVWVGPDGAGAEGTALALAAAADQTGMAPGATLGSATPVDDPEAADLVAAAADENGRDARSYREMTADGLTLTAPDALARGAVETVQATLPGFTAWLDGRPGRAGPIETAGAPVQERGMPWYLEALRVLTDPNLLFFLLLLGLAGVGFELLHPGGFVPAAVGGLSLLLAAAGLAAAPFHPAGIALIAVGVGFFVMEIQIGGVGAYAAVGIAALAGGGVVLLGSDDPALAPSVGVIVATAAVVGGAFAVAARVVRRARRRPPPGGGAGLVGQIGRARAAIGPGIGSVLVNGEIWAARATDGAVIPAGTGVRVVTVQVDDLTLTVEPREG